MINRSSMTDNYEYLSMTRWKKGRFVKSKSIKVVQKRLRDGQQRILES